MKNNENSKEKDIMLFEQEVKELTDEQLDKVAGGGQHSCPPYCPLDLLINRCRCADGSVADFDHFYLPDKG